MKAIGRIDEKGGYVAIDFRGCSSQELSEVYQAFALLCVREKVRWALLKTGDEDADAHYALRDILMTVARIAGIPVRFRLALVAGSDAIVQVGQTMQKELGPLGCDARIFRAEGRASEWLRTRKPPQQRPVAEAA